MAQLTALGYLLQSCGTTDFRHQQFSDLGIEDCAVTIPLYSKNSYRNGALFQLSLQ